MTSEALARGVTSVESGDLVYVARLPTGPLLVLDGGAATIWRQLADGGAAGTLRERVAATLLDPPPDLGEQIEAFIETLRAHGMLSG